MKTVIFGITWGAPHNVVFFILLLAAIAILSYWFMRKKHAAQVLAGSWVGSLIKGFSTTKLLGKIMLMTTGIFFLCIALLRPQWNNKEEIIMQEGRDLFIALDISRSMLATDCVPDRLTCAKEKIKELVKQLDAERVGLILFSGSAFVQCPLTADYAAFNLYLDQVDVETISSGSTALDQAIKETIRAFTRLPERKNKLLVLLTDGEDFSSNLHTLKQHAQQSGLHIFALGVGTQEGAPIPLYDTHGKRIGHQKDDNGSIVITRLHDEMLRALTNDAGGIYLAITDDDTDIRTLVSKVKQFEREALNEHVYAQLEEQYPYFLLISFICFALEWLL